MDPWTLPLSCLNRSCWCWHMFGKAKSLMLVTIIFAPRIYSSFDFSEIIRWRDKLDLFKFDLRVLRVVSNFVLKSRKLLFLFETESLLLMFQELLLMLVLAHVWQAQVFNVCSHQLCFKNLFQLRLLWNNILERQIRFIQIWLKRTYSGLVLKSRKSLFLCQIEALAHQFFLVFLHVCNRGYGIQFLHLKLFNPFTFRYQLGFYFLIFRQFFLSS